MKDTAMPERAQSRKPRLFFAAAVVAALIAAAILAACDGPLSIRFPLTGSVVINNTFPRTGDWLSARYVRGNGINAPTWQWYYDDGTEIQGANRQTYQVTQNDYDEGRAFYVKVSFEGNTGSLYSEATATVTRGPDKVCRTVFELLNWLASQPANDPSSPYVIELNVDSITSSQLALQTVLNNNSSKYVHIDLSGSSLTTIPQNAFFDSNLSLSCSTLTGITIPNSVTSIGDGAFYNCIRLTSVTIPNSVTAIGNYAFEGCENLASITIPSGVTSIGDSAFRNCASLAKITIPGSVESIGELAFINCNHLASVTIGSGVASIGQYAFQDCAALTSITIPSSVTSIGMQAFDLCQNLTSVTFAAGSNIADAKFGNLAFPEGSDGYGGDSLKTAYIAGGAGTYELKLDGSSYNWVKQP